MVRTASQRKGELLKDDSDKRTKLEKAIAQDKEKKQNRLSRLFSTERTRVIKERIAHYEKTGNERKLAIYRSKL